MIPASSALFQNYPNPFNPTTTICFQVATSGMVTLRVYDMLGRELATLINEVRSPGLHRVVFDVQKSTPGFLASGVYFCRLTTRDLAATRPMLLMK